MDLQALGAALPSEPVGDIITIGDLRFTAQINLFAEAFTKVQRSMSKAKKDTSGQVGTRKTKFADLEAVWDACRDALTANNISVLQPTSSAFPQGIAGAEITVHTLMLHTSGQWILNTLKLRSENASPQAVGSCITYAKRYALEAIVGIAREDDDGAAAMQPPASALGMGMANAGMGVSSIPNHPAPPVLPTSPFPSTSGEGLHGWPGGKQWACASGPHDGAVVRMNIARHFAHLSALANITEAQFMAVLSTYSIPGYDLAQMNPLQYAEIDSRLRARIPAQTR